MTGAPPISTFAFGHLALTSSTNRLSAGSVLVIIADAPTMSRSARELFLGKPIDRHIDAQVDDIVAVGLQGERHDVLADVVDVTLDGTEDDLALSSRPPSGAA